MEGGVLEPAGVMQKEEEELEVPEVEGKVERVLEEGVSKVLTEKEQELEMRLFESKEEVNSGEKKSVTEPE